MQKNWKKNFPFYRKDLREKARVLRTFSTKAEILLWKEIKNRTLGVQWHRQVPIGNFIVDFFCHEISLAIELDGLEHNEKHAVQYDLSRQKCLEAQGITVVRFDDDQVIDDREEVLRTIQGVFDFLSDAGSEGA